MVTRRSLLQLLAGAAPLTILTNITMEPVVRCYGETVDPPKGTVRVGTTLEISPIAVAHYRQRREWLEALEQETQAIARDLKAYVIKHHLEAV